MPRTCPGNQVFTAAGGDLLGTLNALIQGFSTGDTATTTALTSQLGTALSQVSTQRASLDGAMNRLQSASSYASREQTQLVANQTNLLQADLPTARDAALREHHTAVGAGVGDCHHREAGNSVRSYVSCEMTVVSTYAIWASRISVTLYTDAGVRWQCEARSGSFGVPHVDIACAPGGAITCAGALRRIPAVRRTPSAPESFSGSSGRKRGVCSDSCTGPASSTRQVSARRSFRLSSR